MADYIMLMKLTEQGSRDVSQVDTQIEMTRQAWKAVGGEMKTAYLTMGEYDLVAIGEGDDDKVASLSMFLARQGSVTTLTMRAFGEEEVQKLIASMPPQPVDSRHWSLPEPQA